jgi:hypothetical protein
MEQRGRILGIGGVFFKSANRDQMREWYSKHLGLADKGQGAMLPWRELPSKEMHIDNLVLAVRGATAALSPRAGLFLLYGKRTSREASPSFAQSLLARERMLECGLLVELEGRRYEL